MSRPNIVLIMPDQQRWDSLACYGNRFVESPHVDRLAREGVRFAQAFTPWPLCTPARATMWTGVYPHLSGLNRNVFGIDDAFASFARVKVSVFDLLRQYGYRTAHFGKWHLGERQPRFFDVWEECFNSLSNHWIDSGRDGTYRADVQTERSIAFLEAHPVGGQPFAMVQAYYPPHDPFTAPRRFYEAYRGKGVPFAGYYAAVSAIDENVGRIMASLERTGHRANTTVIYFSDHGETFYYRQDGEHKFVCHEEAVRVPFIVSWPGKIGSGVVIDRPVGLQDLFPTILDLANVPIPDHLQGRSVLPLIENRESVWRDHFYFQNVTWVNPTEQRCIRTRCWKLIAGANGEHSLYDLENDPEEELDLFYTPRDDLYGRYRREPDHSATIVELGNALRDAAAALDDPTGVRLGDRVLSAIEARRRSPLQPGALLRDRRDR